MIANIARRGDYLFGLLDYLYGPGKFNEHTNQHMVASSDLLHERFSGKLDKGQLKQLTKQVNIWQKIHNKKARKLDKKTGKYKDAPLWHCVLSIGEKDGQLDDETWQKIANDFMAKMGFSGPQVDDGCRWVAVRHGLSKNGNDHVHIVMNLTTENGRIANIHNDAMRASKAAAEIEKKYGLQIIESRQHNRSSRDRNINEYHQGKTGEELTPRQVCEQYIRKAALEAKNEAEFVTILRQNNIAIRPYWAKGGREKVVGYAVGLYEDGKVNQWFSAGKISRDLTIVRLRQDWEQAPAEQVISAWIGKKNNRQKTSKKQARQTKDSTQSQPALNQNRADKLLAESLKAFDGIDKTSPEKLAIAAKYAANIFAALSVEKTNSLYFRMAKRFGTFAQTKTMYPGDPDLAKTCQDIIRALRGRKRRKPTLLAPSKPAPDPVTLAAISVTRSIAASLAVQNQQASQYLLLDDLNKLIKQTDPKTPLAASVQKAADNAKTATEKTKPTNTNAATETSHTPPVMRPVAQPENEPKNQQTR